MNEQLFASWSDDKIHMLFTHAGKNPEVSYFYYIRTSELFEIYSLAEWLRHLEEKFWYNRALREQIYELLKKGDPRV